MDASAPRVLPLPLVGIVLGLVLAAGAATFLTATARAEVSGPCAATIAGADVGPRSSTSTGDAIDVDHNSDVVVTMSSTTQGFRSHVIKLRFMGNIIPARNVETRTDNGETQFTETVKVSDYAWAGVGLYKVSGVATLADGTRCTGAALVNVTGRNPLTTVAGGVAAGVAAVGTVGAAASGVAGALGNTRPLSAAGEAVSLVEQAANDDERRRREDELRETYTRPDTPNSAFLAWLFDFWPVFGCLCFAVVAILMTPLLALTGGAPGGAPPGAPAAAPAAGAPRGLPAPRWRPRLTLVGVVGGLLAGAGVLVLLQQFAVIYPTIDWAVCLLVIGAVLHGLVVPTLGYTVGWMRLRGRIARLQGRLGG